MQLDRYQIGLIAASLILFGLIYFGCDTTPPQIRDNEKSLSQNIESTSVQNLLKNAVKTLNREQKATIDLLTQETNAETDSILKENKLMQLSGKWYEFGQPALAGFYAQLIAESRGNESSWSVAGTTYALCVKTSQDQITKDFCSKRALMAFENAISINPDNVDHRINMALVNVDNPPNGQPMTGILQLRELNQKYPENVAVINQLARLAIQTNQIDKAIERLTQSLTLDPMNRTSICLMAEAQSIAGGKEAAEYKEKCRLLSGN